MESTPPLAALALAITSQDWTSLGLGDDPNIAATSDFDTTVERLTALLLVRLVAIAAPADDEKYPDLSTTTICRAHLLDNEPWPEPINDKVIAQLRAFCARILGTYNDTPYHNMEHAYHVTISINKLLDLILNSDIQGQRLHPTYGLRSDALMQLVLVFSALCHDAEHRGVPNRQLAAEDDPLAILYNDQSIAENRSLFLGFSVLVQDDFQDLRKAMFITPDEYRRFRKATVNLVLTTDIASPERTQIGKSKWKEAFGDPFETVERKVRSELRRRQSGHGNAGPSVLKVRRASTCSMYSEITTDIVEGDYDNDDEISPSITPDSSYNGEEYSVDDDLFSDESQDGMIVSSKPFSNIVSSSQMYQTTPAAASATAQNQQQVRTIATTTSSSTGGNHKGPPQAAQLGYEPDSDEKAGGQNLHQELGYRDNTSMSKQSLSPPSDTKDTKDGGQQRANLVAKANMRFQHFPGKKALPNPMATRNMSMSDFKREDSFKNIRPKDKAKFQRRFSTSVVHSQQAGSGGPKKFKYRLGILRAVDLSGEAIETYSRGGSVTGASMASGRSPSIKSGIAGSVGEEVDELKVTVIMEQLMTACDVAHNLQSFDHMVKWSNRLFLELKRAHKEGRGPDPKNNWHPNQIGFLESYLLPLARRLEDTGVFGDVIGPVFARIVEANRDQWLADGLGITTDIIREGVKRFPVEGEGAT